MSTAQLKSETETQAWFAFIASTATSDDALKNLGRPKKKAPAHAKPSTGFFARFKR